MIAWENIIGYKSQIMGKEGELSGLKFIRSLKYKNASLSLFDRGEIGGRPGDALVGRDV